ncbi:hypothetical protein TNCT_478541 [Trichonephila clavata]|uniref:Uncharacterized protein n=1 Tax=Trichonephila clavata TaxID=2740835 RepID=A0A8X6LU47_TRICU|nr:hypothetical protein TNCT_478541 [Trichonephila clavata]
MDDWENPREAIKPTLKLVIHCKNMHLVGHEERGAVLKTVRSGVSVTTEQKKQQLLQVNQKIGRKYSISGKDLYHPPEKLIYDKTS